MLGELTLRPMVPEDASPLSDAFRAIGWSKPHEIFRRYHNDEIAGVRWTRVAEWKGQLTGYVTILWEAQDPRLREMGVPEITDLNVLPAFRNKGIGGVLLDAAELEASHRSETVGIRVGLHSGYGAAQRIYVRRGYVPDGSGVAVGGQIPEEGSNIRLDDDATLRLMKQLNLSQRNPRRPHVR